MRHAGPLRPSAPATPTDSRRLLAGRGASVGQHPARAREVAGVAVREALQVVLVLRLGLPERTGRGDLGHRLAGPQPGRLDIGASYRSAIFYLDEEQRRVAEDTIADVEASGLWPGKVVTEVAPAGPFWEAEPEHQDYLERYPNGYTCHFPRPGWVLPRRSAAAR